MEQYLDLSLSTRVSELKRLRDDMHIEHTNGGTRVSLRRQLH